MKKFFLIFAAVLLLLPFKSYAQTTEDELNQKINSLDQQLKALQQQMQDLQKQKEEAAAAPAPAPAEAKKAADWPNWLEIGGDYRFRGDYLRGTIPAYYQFDPTKGTATQVSGFTVKNNTLFTNRFGLNLKARATEDIQVKARLLMYKVWGEESSTPVTSDSFFTDRAGVFDGTITHVPDDNALRVDYAYATWSNVGGAPVWFSIGRRPSTGGLPSNIREFREKPGTAGIPSIMVDYAFDGATLGVAPYIEALPGAYAKICYGKGYDSGFRSEANSLHDTQMIGVNVVPYDTDNLTIELQWNRAIDIFDFPPDFVITNPNLIKAFGTNTFQPSANLGNIDQFGGVVTGKVLENLNLFASAALSKTHPNGHRSMLGPGLLDNAGTTSHTGYGLYVGGRYDMPSTGTMIGAEYNHGSKNWITFAPAADDMWTSKLGTRGNVYEGYVIQEIKKRLISKNGLAFFRLGYQYYTFNYTGSNSWLGSSVSMDDLNNPMNAQLFAPVRHAQDIYLTFDVRF